MLDCKRQNYHRSKLPKPGTICVVVGLGSVNPKRKCMVSHYGLCDNVLPFSVGIHTAFVRFLDNGEVKRYAWQWLQEV